MPRNCATSEVGSNPRANNMQEMLRQIFTEQNNSLCEMVRRLSEPNTVKNVTLPKFNSDISDSDAVSWCSMVELIFAEKPLEGVALVSTLSCAMLGEASNWLTQICFPGITWLQFKNLFLQRFGHMETSAATIYKLLNNGPKVGETISAYGSRLISAFETKLKQMSVEKICVTLTLAHMSNIDQRLKKLACTSEISNRSELLNELNVFSYYETNNKVETVTAKRAKYSTFKCHYCGKEGHKIAECRAYKDQRNNKRRSVSLTPAQKEKKTIICFKCGQSGHISTACHQSNNRNSEANKEKVVNICTKLKPKGTLSECGKFYDFYFDSGSDCSLIKEKIAAKFSGKRHNNLVILKGIGNATVYSTMQITTNVTINSYTFEIMFHVVLDSQVEYDIMIGRDILCNGFCVTMTGSKIILSKLKTVDTCSNTNLLNFTDVNTDLEDVDKARLVSTLQEYSEWLITGIPKTRITTGELEIRLIDPNKTVQRRPYRLSPHEREIVRKEIGELLKANVIQQSTSPFASPMIMVKKKDGSNRLCIDYRELNSNTVADKYPLPLISDQIARFQGAMYFSQLDMASGFHQVPINPNSVQYTAFVTPDGHYEYRAMPFGLKNAPACFQRAIITALGDLAHSYVVVYMDDVMILANNKEQAFERLKLVLDVLTKAGFSLKLGKCSFLKTKVTYLGYQINAGEIRPNAQKIHALSKLPPPNSITQLRQFIGLSTYFRQFIPNFSLIMKPLYRLTSGKTLIWNSDMEQIRSKVISILTNEPVLVIFNPQHPIELHTDASSIGFGAILLHRIDNKPYVVEFFSKTTTSAESRYTSYELETLAVVNSIKHFRHYLLGRRFLVFTDCNSLKASRTKQELTPRVHRWWGFLQSFDFEIQYREGKRMAHVDFLSRNPIVKGGHNLHKVEEKRVNLADISNDWLLAEQQRDSDISNIVTKLNNHELSDDSSKTYELRRGLLYRRIQRFGKTKCLPIVPRSMRWSVINNIHESVMHLGFEKTLDKVFQYYWFENMSKYVKKFIDNCITCKVSKSHSGKTAAELHPIPKVDIPWHTVHVDITGKLSGKSDLKEYLIVTIDAFTKYVLLHHTHNINAESCIRALKTSISLFGVPTRIIADQGRSFSSKEYRDFCSSQNISLHLIATGASRANGQVERVMGTLKNMLTAVETSQRSWQDAVDEVQLAINSTVNRITKSSPLELFIGKEARPFGLMATDSEVLVDRQNIRDQAIKNINKNAYYEKFRFDKNKAPVIKFNVGDFVLLKNEERHQTKLDPKYRGPLKITEVLDGDRYTLKSLNSNRVYKCAHEYLRKLPDVQECISRNPELIVGLDNENSVERDAMFTGECDGIERNPKETTV